ncbi:MAG: PAS domain S-box protein, partial [Verrucomicrobiales bacterium]
MKLSIRRKMILFIGVPSTLIIIGAMVWVLGFAEKQARRAHQAEMAETATMAAASFDEHLSRAARVADSTARFVGFLPDLKDEQIYGILNGNVDGNRRIFGAAMAFEPGSYKEGDSLFSPYVHRNPDGEGLAKMNIDAGVYDWYNDEEWTWWHLPKNSGEGEWTDPYFDEGAGQILMTTYATPFQRNGAFGGVTTVDIDLQTLHTDITEMIPHGHDFYILGGAGQIIFSPVASEIMGKSIFEILAAKGRSDLNDEVQRMISGGNDEMTLDDLMGDGRKMYAYAPIASPGWTLVTYMPEDHALADFNRRKRILTGSFLSAAMMILGVTLFASGRLSKPIHTLRERVLRIADGESGVRVDDVRTGDEIEELAGAFSIMQAKVADRESKLENARETTLTDLLESAPDAMMIADSEGKICRLNSQMMTIFGYPREELIGMSIEKLIPERFRAGHGAHMDGYFKNPTARQMGAARELSGLRKDGSEFPIEIGLSPFHEPEGVMVVSAIRDITKRRESEDELRKLNQAVEQGSAIVFITDHEGLIEYVNQRFIEVTGYQPDEVIGQTPRILKSGFQDPSVYKDVWETLRDGREWRGEFCNQRKDGKMFWASAALAPIRDHHGEISHFVAIEEDISEEREIAESIKEKERRFRTLVDNIPGTVYRC